MDKNIVVTCKNVKKSYGKGEISVPALRDINLEVKAGELLIVSRTFRIRKDDTSLCYCRAIKSR